MNREPVLTTTERESYLHALDLVAELGKENAELKALSRKCDDKNIKLHLDISGQLETALAERDRLTVENTELHEKDRTRESEWAAELHRRETLWDEERDRLQAAIREITEHMEKFENLPDDPDEYETSLHVWVESLTVSLARASYLLPESAPTRK